MKVDRECSNCGEKGHNTRTCIAEKKGMFKLFGVKIIHSNENIKTSYQRKGVLWNEEEHASILHGLQELGRGDWKNISKKFVTTRSPSQIASHAQKYFGRRNGRATDKLRKSIFDQEVEHPDQLGEAYTKTLMTSFIT
uniref:Uncharacterized protein n=1 Tax=Kalanchoe fedtschenkoi TaxID=63787 RepID=A0A7N0RH49_KALFE